MGTQARTWEQRVAYFWSKVEKGAGCWVYTDKLSGGYGHFWNGEKTEGAHRFSYKLAHGDIPEGMHLDHICRNRACVRAEHLEAVSHRTNVLRGVGPTAINAKKTHCPKGHLFGSAETYTDKKGGRYCRICIRQRHRSLYAKKMQGIIEAKKREGHYVLPRRGWNEYTCKRGHVVNRANAYFRPKSGNAACRKCRTEDKKNQNKKLKEQRRSVNPPETYVLPERGWTQYTCKRGHVVTRENAYHPPGNPNSKSCGLCRKRAPSHSSSAM